MSVQPGLLRTLLPLMLLAVPLLAPAAGAQAVQALPARLPGAEWGASAVWTGEAAYVFGGESCLTTIDCTFTDQILRFDPTAGTVVVTDARLPTPRAHGSAVWDGRHAYLLGGIDETGALDQIVRFDPATGAVETLAAKLPTPLRYTSAVFDGTSAHLFGGTGTYAGESDRIVRFTPAEGTVEHMRARLVDRKHGTAAVWDGRFAYVFGGYSYMGFRSLSVFSPEADELRDRPDALPGASQGMAAFWDGDAAYLLGGGLATPTRDIVRYHPASGTVERMRAELPQGMSGVSAVWTGEAAYVFGGEGGAITRYEPRLDDPPLPAAEGDDAPGPQGEAAGPGDAGTPGPGAPLALAATALAAILARRPLRGR